MSSKQRNNAIDTNEALLYELKLAKLKTILQPAIDDAGNGVYFNENKEELRG
ncbi:MAG: hypothetical protein Q9M16_03805 [Mariprofundus sp.]|nr:hypothetical protein [Mariprofundus sp.]